MATGYPDIAIALHCHVGKVVGRLKMFPKFINQIKTLQNFMAERVSASPVSERFRLNSK